MAFCDKMGAQREIPALLELQAGGAMRLAQSCEFQSRTTDASEAQLRAAIAGLLRGQAETDLILAQHVQARRGKEGKCDSLSQGVMSALLEAQAQKTMALRRSVQVGLHRSVDVSAPCTVAIFETLSRRSLVRYKTLHFTV
jgi:predicted transcriptional regulator